MNLLLMSLGYFLVSAVALALDYSLAWLLYENGLSVPVSAALGYIFGLLIAFPLMKRFVFRFVGERFARFPLYILSGAMGVGITFGVSFLAEDVLNLGFHLSKLASVAISFISLFLFRRLVVFRASL